MKLIEVKNSLSKLQKLYFKLPSGKLVPEHFHVTEIGIITKLFIDCGGTIRQEQVVNFQLWNANDYNHRLHPEKLSHIIELSQKKLNINNQLPVEIEYQGSSIEKFGLAFDGSVFNLTTKHTNCLAKDACGISTEKPKVKLSNIQNQSCCSPESGCC